MSMDRSDRLAERGFDRLVAFSDGVVAIAITLLVLPLLDLADDASRGHVVIADSWPRMQAFLITFAVVASFWVIHHRVFQLVDKCNSGLIWANMVWLATIAFLPFAAEVLGVADELNRGVRALYIGALVACSVGLALIDVVILRSPGIWPDGVRPDIDVAGIVTRLVVMFVALLVGTFVDVIGLWALLLIFLARPISRLAQRTPARRGARPGPASPG